MVWRPCSNYLSSATFTDSSSIRVALFVLDKIMAFRSGGSSLSKTGNFFKKCTLEWPVFTTVINIQAIRVFV